MQLLMDDPALRQRLGEAGRREVAARFSAQRMVENTIKVYEEVLREARKE
jgi:glycosyltransferase involved in cell wall biosynthesis